MVNIGNDWDELLASEWDSEYYRSLRGFLASEYKSRPGKIYPRAEDIFTALKLCPLHEAKAVIFGQDPYHGENQAHGLSFSVREGVEIPPSLRNIFIEMRSDLSASINTTNPTSGDLSYLAKQGVLLLNAVLTVRAGEANSHQGKGWETLTDRIISLLNEREQPMVFMLWGRNAKEKAPLVSNKRHLILKAAHPSPLSAYNGFFGCKHFSKANEFLSANGMEAINWLP